MRRGMTPVVAVALVMGMTVVASGGAYTFVTTATQQGMDEASASLATSTEVRSIRCDDTTVAVGLSNTGDRELVAADATAYLHREGELVETAETSLDGADVLQPGGFSELAFPFTTYLSPGTRYTVEVSFADTGHVVERTCQAGTGDLIGYWNFDDVSSRTVPDLAGDNDGTFTGMDGNATLQNPRLDGTLTNVDFDADSGWTTGVAGGALALDGTDDYVAVPESNASDLREGTVTAWVRLRDIGDKRNAIVYKQNSYMALWTGTDPSIRTTIQDEDGTWYAAKYFGRSDPAFWEDTWHHLASVYDQDSGELRLYVDGERVNTTTGDAGDAIHDNDHQWRVGHGKNHGRPTNGTVDDVRVYDRPLTGSEIRSVMDDRPVPDDSTVIYYPFDEGSGGTAWNSAFQAPGMHGRAVRLNGTHQQYLQGPSTTIPQEYTLELWVKGESGAQIDENIYTLGWNGKVGLALQNGGGNARGGLLVRNAANDGYHEVWSGTSVLDGEWHHIAATVDRSTLEVRVYIDGELDTTDTLPDHFSGARNILAGTWSDGYGHVTGRIDDARVYDRTLSQGEIREDMQGGPAQHGIIAYYPMDGPEGRTVFDTGFWRTGANGGAARFDGLDDFVTAGTSSDFDITGPVTVAVWANQTDTGGDTDKVLVTTDDETHPNTNGGFSLNYGWGTDLYFRAIEQGNSTDAAAEYTNGISLDDRHHLVGVFDGSRLLLYVDGQQVAADTDIDGQLRTSDFPLRFGGTAVGGNYPFNGTLDEVRLYGAALSAEQVSALHDATD